ncbi:MAG: hypothetical protein ABIA93_03130 [Candidatus Woesearchaeota archaeon]
MVRHKYSGEVRTSNQGVESKLSIFHAYDIRGIYPKEINEDIAYRIARAFVHVTKAKKVLIGRDTRTSSPTLYEHAIQGIRHSGAQPVLLGTCSTPAFSWTLAKMKLDAGMMITASHNSKEYNGVKLYGEHASAMGIGTGLDEVERAMNIKRTPSIKKKKVARASNNEYIRFLKKNAPKKIVKKYVVDASGGPAGHELLSLKLPKTTIINAMPDPEFKAHSPNPLEENATAQLKSAVESLKASAGFILDGDADRVLVVDEQGNTVHPNYLAAFIIDRLPKGSTVVVDATSSRTIIEVARKKKIKLILSPVGRSNVLERMKKHEAIFGSESSGHYFHKDCYYLDNGILTMLKTMKHLEKSNRTVSELLKQYQKYQIQDVVLKNTTMDKVIKALNPQKTTRKFDGISFETKDSWGYVRQSNTEPVVRLRIETKGKY